MSAPSWRTGATKRLRPGRTPAGRRPARPAARMRRAGRGAAGPWVAGVAGVAGASFLALPRGLGGLALLLRPVFLPGLRSARSALLLLLLLLARLERLCELLRPCQRFSFDSRLLPKDLLLANIARPRERARRHARERRLRRARRLARFAGARGRRFGRRLEARRGSRAHVRVVDVEAGVHV